MASTDVTVNSANWTWEDWERYLAANQDKIDVKLEPFPVWEIVIKSVFYAIVIIFSLIGNILIIVVVVRNKRMRTTTNYYIVNLAVADLCVTLFCTWVHLVNDLTHGWILGAFFCKVNSFAQVLSLVSSILTLTVIASDRFFGIVFAMKAHISERRASTMIVLTWIVAATISSPLLVFRKLWTRRLGNITEVICSDEWPTVVETVDGEELVTMPARKVYYITVSVVLFFMPIAIMTAAYSMIIWRLWSSKMPGERVDSEACTQNKVKKRVIVMLIMILSAFVVCWLPYQIIILWAELRQDSTSIPTWYKHFRYFALFIAYSNSAMNPAIYAGFNENFQKGFRETLKCLRKKRRYSSIEMRTDSYHSQVMSQTQITSVKL